MYRIDVVSAVASRPAVSALGTEGYFRDADTGAGVQGTVLPANFLNMLMVEMEGIRALNPAGDPGVDKGDDGQLAAAILALVGGGGGVHTGWGSVANYVDLPGGLRLACGEHTVANPGSGGQPRNVTGTISFDSAFGHAEPIVIASARFEGTTFASSTSFAFAYDTITASGFDFECEWTSDNSPMQVVWFAFGPQ